MRLEVNATHTGYMDGLEGKDPNPELQGLREYSEAWLVGAQDREDGLTAAPYLGPCDVPLKAWDEVTIPKGAMVRNLRTGKKPAGRTYKVKIHDVHQGMPAHYDWGREFQRPTPPEIVWPGTGGYWSYLDVNEVLREQA